MRRLRRMRAVVQIRRADGGVSMETKSIMIVGVGGQGSLLASKLLGRLLLSRGYDIKVSEVHGMSQRGGDYLIA